jgi:FkbH-like protein
MAILRNYTIETIDIPLRLEGFKSGFHLTTRYGGYDPTPETLSETLDPDPDVVVLLLRLEEFTSALTRDRLAMDSAKVPEVAQQIVTEVIDLIVAIRGRSAAPVLLSTFIGSVAPAAGILDTQLPFGHINLVRRLNADLVERLSTIDGAYIIDIDHYLSQLGLHTSIDKRGTRLADAPLSPSVLPLVARFLVRHLSALEGPRKKCIVVDCDNTLWGGVVGEDGLGGIQLGESGVGRRFRDFQQQLLDMRRRGVLLAICSRNEPQDVIRVLRDHSECVLSEEDFAVMRINWQDKSANLIEIAEELSLSLEHIVFIDDDAVECDAIRSRLPDLLVLQYPSEIVGDVDGLGLFDFLAITAEDASRTALYRTELNRRASASAGMSAEDHLRSLELVATVGVATDAQFGRIAQLTQRTNQFNLTTRRYGVAEIEQMATARASAVLWLTLRDRFGDYGLVGCGIVRCTGDTASIDTFLLSCRILARRVDGVLANRVATQARRLGAKKLIGEYRPSGRNQQVSDLYTRLGFERLEPSGEVDRWIWDLAAPGPPVPSWVEIVDLELKGP